MGLVCAGSGGGLVSTQGRQGCVWEHLVLLPSDLAWIDPFQEEQNPYTWKVGVLKYCTPSSQTKVGLLPCGLGFIYLNRPFCDLSPHPFTSSCPVAAQSA